ncbi:MAG: hypothetical protein GYB68_18395 [Chloroflexi bacterium]|nr:hypothetical protein [Chloroflexota bacterium]
MTKFIASHPGVLVRQPIAQAIIDLLPLHCKPLIGSLGLSPANHPGWMHQQDLLNLLRQVESRREGNPFGMVSIGLRLARVVTDRLSADRSEDVLRHLKTFYQRAHRFESPMIGWTYQEHAPGLLRMTSNTPYPSDLEYGLLYGLLQHYRSPNQTFLIEQQSGLGGVQAYRVHLRMHPLPSLWQAADRHDAYPSL